VESLLPIWLEAVEVIFDGLLIFGRHNILGHGIFRIFLVALVDFVIRSFDLSALRVALRLQLLGFAILAVFTGNAVNLLVCFGETVTPLVGPAPLVASLIALNAGNATASVIARRVVAWP